MYKDDIIYLSACELSEQCTQPSGHCLLDSWPCQFNKRNQVAGPDMFGYVRSGCHPEGVSGRLAWGCCWEESHIMPRSGQGGIVDFQNRCMQLLTPLFWSLPRMNPFWGQLHSVAKLPNYIVWTRRYKGSLFKSESFRRDFEEGSPRFNNPWCLWIAANIE